MARKHGAEEIRRRMRNRKEKWSLTGGRVVGSRRRMAPRGWWTTARVSQRLPLAMRLSREVFDDEVDSVLSSMGGTVAGTTLMLCATG